MFLASSEPYLCPVKKGLKSAMHCGAHLPWKMKLFSIKDQGTINNVVPQSNESLIPKTLIWLINYLAGAFLKLERTLQLQVAWFCGKSSVTWVAFVAAFPLCNFCCHTISPNWHWQLCLSSVQLWSFICFCLFYCCHLWLHLLAAMELTVVVMVFIWRPGDGTNTATISLYVSWSSWPLLWKWFFMKSHSSPRISPNHAC